MKAATAFVVTALLCACADEPSRGWYKTGATQSEFNTAKARCRMGLAGLPNLPPTSGAGQGRGGGLIELGDSLHEISRNQLYMQDCMTAQGWEYR